MAGRSLPWPEWCQCGVNDENGPIQPGDLLTASSTPGEAMRAGPNPPPGTVIGKALGSLAAGHGSVPMLVLAH
ncbi:MAG: hypothetical protein KatS3mg061_3453 [Dehalococcoidia bacterium]|nr:MAG: hypothetical protein KatS3mg061_3453 [Dehalococcoidia bacterium]